MIGRDTTRKKMPAAVGAATGRRGLAMPGREGCLQRARLRRSSLGVAANHRRHDLDNTAGSE
jgi:hypothetical protein